MSENEFETYRVHRPEKQFTTNGWPNYITAEVGGKKRLSPKAVLILLHIKGQSDTWVPRKKNIMKALGIGSNNSYEKYIKELIKCGYVSMDRGQSEKTGHWYTNYVFYFDPVENPNFSGELPERYYDREDYEIEKTKEYRKRQQKSPSADETDEQGDAKKDINKNINKGLTTNKSITENSGSGKEKQNNSSSNETVGNFTRFRNKL